MVSGNPDSSRMLKTLSTASEVLELVGSNDGVGVTELAGYLNMGKSTAYRYLKSLEELGFVTCSDNEYYLGYQLLLLGESKRNSARMSTHSPRRLAIMRISLRRLMGTHSICTSQQGRMQRTTTTSNRNSSGVTRCT
jgi:DNA-binding IclR family transcriptional regulator